MTAPRTVWIVRGEVTDLSAYPNNPEVRLGDTEWQFSDAPVGQRGYSADYVSLEQGLAEHEDCILLHEDSDGFTVHGGRPDCPHQWVEWEGGEPARDVCTQCGGVKW